ncbi:MAG: sugar transferase [Candidatus Kapabacteria bacterium]|nr:sugar transferase [Candidatus Kapabacteria bacterium]
MNTKTINQIDSNVNYFDLNQNNLPNSQYRGKRILDISFSLILIVIFIPFFILVPILIYLFDEKQIFFIHERIGLNGKPFQMYKFKSMKNSLKIFEFDDNGDLIKNNSSITHLGKFLRKTSIDEIPQLFNVIKGDMSLVGPRPLIREVANVNIKQSEYRTNVKPGLTGLWQINNRIKYNLDDMIDYDIEYIEKQSIWLDLKIILLTVPSVISMKGAV